MSELHKNIPASQQAQNLGGELIPNVWEIDGRLNAVSMQHKVYLPLYAGRGFIPYGTPFASSPGVTVAVQGTWPNTTVDDNYTEVWDVNRRPQLPVFTKAGVWEILVESWLAKQGTTTDGYAVAVLVAYGTDARVIYQTSLQQILYHGYFSAPDITFTSHTIIVRTLRDNVPFNIEYRVTPKGTAGDYYAINSNLLVRYMGN